MPKLKRDRPTIGILAGWSPHEGGIPERYISAIVSGIQSAAISKQCHLLMAWGVGRVVDTTLYPAWPILTPETDFVPVGPWNTDGLIVFVPLRSAQGAEYLQELRAQGHPVLFIAPGEPGPTIAVKGTDGIRQGIGHLVEHGHRHIAFIAGQPTDKGDSASRLSAYHLAVAEFNLAADPRLVVWGWHRSVEGYQAMRELLACGVEFTAVLASNDNSAIGAMRAIQEAGLKIPGDIAIIGFDDQSDAAVQVPPLTSVHVPLTLVGEQALTMMADHLTEQTPLESLQISTRLVCRQSCGCVPEVITSAAKGGPQAQPVLPQAVETSAQALVDQRAQFVNEMLTALPAKLRYPDGTPIHDICAGLVEAFFASLTNQDKQHFQEILMDSVHKLELTSGSSDLWQEMISILRRGLPEWALDWEEPTWRFAEDLLHQARVAISESAQRQAERHKHYRDLTIQSLSELTARLSAALNEQQAIEYLNLHLADVRIRHARVSLFEREGDDPVAWSVTPQAGDASSDQRFATREFPPPGLYPPGEKLNLALLPLVFQDEAFGYVAFDASDLGPCAVIARQLAATLKTCRLHAQVVELSLTDPLTGLANRRYFEIYLKNEASRSQRFGRALTIILIDVDRFKEYNDTYGHPAGDLALQQAAKCLAANRRSVDVVARIGGDEFVMILPETELDGALQVTRKIRTSLAQLSGLERPLTLSIGITSVVGADADSIVQQADTALYAAKRAGRNRDSVFIAGEQTPDE